MDATVESRVRAGLEAAAGSLPDGLPRPPLAGKLLRPLVAWACTTPAGRAPWDPRLARGALAVQMVHEASLLHDDIVDGAATRRGRPTGHARDGVGPALVQGDHLLTAAYRVAAGVGSPAFLDAFIEATERTVAGEIAQGRSAGRVLDPAAYDAMVADKSGALFGCVAALPAAVAGGDVEGGVALGRRVGTLYQRVDDLLDYCAATRRGKPPLQDWRQGKWTWVLEGVEVEGFDVDPDEVRRRLFRAVRPGEATPMEAALARLEADVEALLGEHRRRVGDDDVLEGIVGGWLGRAREAVALEASRVLDARPEGASRSAGAAPAHRDVVPASARDEVAGLARGVGGPTAWPAYFGGHARSFRFAAWLFPRQARARVAGVYAFCRFTDDLVDEAGDAPLERVRERLEAWRELARRAHGGHATGIPLLDVVLGETAVAGVGFRYADALVTGVGMDLEPVRFPTLDALDGYADRVAGAVGGWLTELSGVHDALVLERAHDLGRAMQLTNILRDVGEDWRRGRLYLPADALERHGLTKADVARMAAGVAMPPGWADLLEDLMATADARYERALRALPDLPATFRRPVAVAARVYQGIHAEIRRGGHDVGTWRAHTSLPRKLLLAARAGIDLRRARSRGGVAFPGREAPRHA